MPQLETIQLAEQLKDNVSSPVQLLQTLKQARIGLRDHSELREAYGSSSTLWSSLQQAWAYQTNLLVNDDFDSIPALTSLAYFSSSLCAGNAHNQEQVLEFIEPSLRKILLFVSSFINLQNEQMIPLTRACCQALSNLVTDNEKIAAKTFPELLKREEQEQLILRLLASEDQTILQAVLIFLLNSVYASEARALLFVRVPSGIAILDRILVLVAVLSAEETSESIAHEEFNSDVFGLSFAIVQQIIKLDKFPQAYKSQTSSFGATVSEAQTNLLKFLDGFLDLPNNAATTTAYQLVPFLIDSLYVLSDDLISDSRAKSASDATTFQASVLVLLCLTNIGLASDQGRELVTPAIESTIDLLRFSQTLAERPPITELTESPSSAWVQPEAVSQLKRSCVRFLGVVSFEQKLAQDSIREFGGINLILSMCQINDANITLREHALFAVRNILKNNETNQSLVDGMKPQYLVGPGGELKDLPAAMRQT